MSFCSTDPASHQSENTWFTPPEIVKPLGEFSIDVCTVSYRPFDIGLRHICHDKAEDSLSSEWSGMVWMNPPYGKQIAPFIDKFKRHDNGIALVFARMGTPWMQKWIYDHGVIFFLRKRISFIDKTGKRATNAGADSCFLVAGKSAIEKVESSGLAGVWNK